MKKDNQLARRQQKLSVDLGPKLLEEVENMRRVLQDANGPGRAVSRGDVVRLALRRLQLAIYTHQSGMGEEKKDALEKYLGVWDDIQADGICPNYLVPGRPGEPMLPSPSKKKGAKK